MNKPKDSYTVSKIKLTYSEAVNAYKESLRNETQFQVQNFTMRYALKTGTMCDLARLKGVSEKNIAKYKNRRDKAFAKRVDMYKAALYKSIDQKVKNYETNLRSSILGD